MASVSYAVTCRDSQADPPGLRMTGLTPTWVFLKRLSDNADVAQPAISEVAQGVYKFSFDAESLTDSVGQIDFGVSLTAPADRYLDVLLTRDSGRILTHLDAAVGSVPEAVLTLDLSAVTGEARRSLLNAVRRLLNRATRAGTVGTVYKEDDSTIAYTVTLGETAGADPVTSMDPD